MKRLDLLFLAILSLIFAAHSAESAFYPVNRGMVNTVTRVTTSAATNEIAATANQVYIATGSANETFDLPNAQNLPNDWWYLFINNSTGTVTVRDFGNTTIVSISAGRTGWFYLKSNATQNGDWEYNVPANGAELANYYLKSEFVASSSGAGDAGKPIKLNGSGMVDSSMIAPTPVQLTVSDTNSVNLTLNVDDLSADVRLSAAAADAGNINATTSIETDGVQVQVPIADTNTTGVISDTDWDTFNGKQDAGNYITALTSDVTASGPGSAAATIANNAVSDAKLRDSAALSVIGRTSNSSGDPADIAAGTNHHVLRRNGTTLEFGSLDISQSGTVGSSVLGVANGGTGIASGTSGGVPYFSGSTTVASSGALSQYQVVLGGGSGGAPNVVSGTGTSGQVLTSNGAGANPTWQDATGGTANIEYVAFGGASDLTACTSDPCTMYQNSSGISGVALISTGVYEISFTGSPFSARPVCTGNNLTNDLRFVVNFSGNSTSIRFTVYNTSAAATNSSLSVICTGT